MNERKASRILGGVLMASSVSTGIVAVTSLHRVPEWMWFANAFALLLFFVGFGAVAQGDLRGIFLNRNNRWSLSHTYTLGWSVLILATFMTFWRLRMAQDFAQPLDIGIDSSLVYLMGITTASFGGAAYISSRKRQVPLDRLHVVERDLDDLVRQTAAKHAWPASKRNEVLGMAKSHAKALTGDPELMQHQCVPLSLGPVACVVNQHLEQAEATPDLVRPTPRKASPFDLLMSEDRANEGRTDLGRAQLLMFTFLARAAFVMTVWNLLGAAGGCTESCLDQLPVVSAGLVSILGASHAGYLGIKATRRGA